MQKYFMKYKNIIFYKRKIGFYKISSDFLKISDNIFVEIKRWKDVR